MCCESWDNPLRLVCWDATSDPIYSGMRVGHEWSTRRVEIESATLIKAQPLWIELLALRGTRRRIKHNNLITTISIEASNTLCNRFCKEDLVFHIASAVFRLLQIGNNYRCFQKRSLR